MILVSKNFLGALRLNLDPKIQDPRILGSEDLENWISGSGSIRRALKKIILTKTTYGLQLLLLTNFYLTPPSGGSLSKYVLVQHKFTLYDFFIICVGLVHIY